ncbi:uncharacterized protein LOC115926504 [Strongylocentrotus purpuratus]|uniref:Uncharacterized protein n=1 Tax=Strongylocentrotus purpuratus TaxID=7668 RepID=A0A7M7P6N0_STRPU|nr:uncharacterized protein LOC115926504 [Strongylocentrotus purpuratus]
MRRVRGSLFNADFNGYFVRGVYNGPPNCSHFGISITAAILTYPPVGSTLVPVICEKSKDSPTTKPTTSVPLETTSPSFPSSSLPPSDHTLTASEELQLLLNPDIIEQKVFDIGMNLSTGQSIEVNNIYVYRSVLEDLCATEWTDTSLNGDRFSFPVNYFCERNDQSKDGNDQRPVTLGIVTSARLAELLNNKTANNATTDNNDVNLRVASNVITAVVYMGHELVSIPFSFRNQNIGDDMYAYNRDRRSSMCN